MRQQHAGDVWKGMAVGFAGGLAGSLVMNGVHSLTEKISQTRKEQESPQHSAHRGKEEGAAQESGDDATVRAADRISQGLFGHPLNKRKKKWAGPAVHYAMGGLTGALYGAAAELVPGVTRGAGLPFGTAVWLGADEVAVPALGLAEPPLQHPPSVHARALAAHLVYGLTTEGVRRLLRGVRSPAPARSGDGR